MPKSAMNPKVDSVISQSKSWREEFEQLRLLILDCGLTEDLKWGQPCYAFQGKNIVLIHGFKDYCALLFFKGALMKDPDGLLIQQTENVQAARQIRFTNLQDIVKAKTALKRYVHEAIEVEKSGLKVSFKEAAQYAVPAEFQDRLDQSSALKAAFEALTSGRQKAYLLHFSSAKQSSTRIARIEKCEPQILEGKGLMD